MQSEREQKKGINRFFHDLKNTKKNWNIVRSSPYATLKLKYYSQLTPNQPEISLSNSHS